MSLDFPDRRAPPPSRWRSRPITLTLLGAAALGSCVCCLFPAPGDAPGADGGGEFGPQPGTATTDRTATSARTATSGRDGNGNGENQRAYRPSYMPFWIPLFLGRGGGYSAPRGNPNVRSTPAPQSSPNVTRGGFGNSGVGGGG